MNILNKNAAINKVMLFMLIFALMFVTGCSATVNNDVLPENSKEQVVVDEINENEVNESEQEPGATTITDGELEVHFIDVGQGDSVLIKQGGNNMLIDAGENNKGKIVVDYLRNEGVETLDYVIGTHPHSDHIGGLDDVIYAFDVKSVIMPEKTHTTKTFEDVVVAVKDKGLKITKPIVGESHNVGDAKFTIIAPNSSEYGNLNDYSVSVKLEYGSNSIILTGDAEKASEQEMVDNGIDLKADVLKAGHHGSDTSSIQSFVDKVDPEYVVMQVGEGNKYKHPNDEVVDRFNNTGAKIYRNDIHGAIIMRSNGADISFDTNKGQAPTTAPVEKPITAEPEPQPEPVDENTSSSESSEGYVGTESTKVFHKLDCSYVPKPENRLDFGSSQEATDAGYRPCKVCKP